MKANASRHKLSLRKYQASAWRVPLRRKPAVARRDPDLGRVWRDIPMPDAFPTEHPSALADLLVDWVRRQPRKPKRPASRGERRAA